MLSVILYFAFGVSRLMFAQQTVYQPNNGDTWTAQQQPTGYQGTSGSWHCDLGFVKNAISVCFDHTDGRGHTTPMTEAEEKVVRQFVEPIDVPAITVVREEEYGNTSWCNVCTPDLATLGSGYCTSMACDPHAKHKVHRITCKDRSRILMESLDGKNWCHKPQPSN